MRRMNTPLFLVVVKRVGNNRIAERCQVSPQYISKLAREFETGAGNRAAGVPR